MLDESIIGTINDSLFTIHCCGAAKGPSCSAADRAAEEKESFVGND